MTYHLEPWIKKIVSPIVLIYPDGERQDFHNGAEVAANIFSEPYRITTIHAIKNTIEISLQDASIPDTETFF